MASLVKRGGWRAYSINRVAGCTLSHGDRSHDIRSAVERGWETKNVENINQSTEQMGHCPLVIPSVWYTIPQSGVRIPMYRTLSGNNKFRRISEYFINTITHTKIPYRYCKKDLSTGINQHPPCLRARHDNVHPKRTIQNLLIHTRCMPQIVNVNF